MNRKPLQDMIWSYGVPDSEGECLNARRSGDRGLDMGCYQRRDDDDYDHDRERRAHGYRRHRSVSSWARNARCRSGMEDCFSSNRWHPGRESQPRRNRVAPEPTLVWRKKTVQAGKKLKKVSFADPIATELKAPKPTIPDDSIQLIMEWDNTNGRKQAEPACDSPNTGNKDPNISEQLNFSSSTNNDMFAVSSCVGVHTTEYVMNAMAGSGGDMVGMQ